MSEPESLKSALLRDGGFKHGFFTRLGGQSRGEFAALNLSLTQGDNEQDVRANRLIVQRALGVNRLVLARQVHGTEAVVLADEDDVSSAIAAPPECDALIACTTGHAVGILTADCVPILIADPESGAAAAVHAGWRGTLHNIALGAVDALSNATGSRPQALIAAMGPAIGPASYKVGRDLADSFADSFGDDVVRREADGPKLDLWAANDLNLQRAGLLPENIELLAEDTYAQPERFFSYRRNNNTGRQGSFIAARQR